MTRALTTEGRGLVEDIAKRHDVSMDAVVTLLEAIERGGGQQAQFSHPALGGMGQWSRNGMIMVGDMFNHDLKARVERLCRDLADLMQTHALLDLELGRSAQGGRAWWPEGCGTPSATGAQNDMGYAYFPETRRLAVRHDGVVTLYDTGAHRIGGASQQQSSGQDLAFTSQLGSVRLHDLTRIDKANAPVSTPEPQAETPQAPQTAVLTPEREAPDRELRSTDDIFGLIERLHDLQRKGILTEAEYAEKKKELLARI